MTTRTPSTRAPLTRAKAKTGTVVFIGAGPGDPGLLTLRAADALATADCVAVPDALRDAVLPRCREDVEVLDVTGLDGPATGKALAAAAKTGHNVARVLPGDPTVLCDFANEADACAKAKVGFELVPGVSAAFAVPAYAGVPVTDKKHRAVHVLDVGPEADEPDWASLAAPRQTLVLLNCADVIGKVAASLVEHGWRGDTPVAVNSGGTTTSQHTVVSTLDTVERDSAVFDAPVLAVVGEVVRLREKLSWWEGKPLFGWKVLVPRTKDQAGVLSERLVSYGAVPVEVNLVGECG